MTKPSNEELSKLSNEIYHKLCSMGANPEDAKEIVQESLYRGFLNIDGIDPKSFRAWLYRVSINQYYDLYRKNNRHQEIELKDYFQTHETSVEDSIIKQENQEENERAIQQLKPLEQKLIKMKYKDEYSYKEISKHLNLKESLVKTYLYRARKRLSEIFRRDNK